MKSKHNLFYQLIPLSLISLVAIPTLGMSYIELSKYIGHRAMPVEVVGTGSMYPSLYWSTTEGGPEDESSKVVEEYRTTPHLFHRFSGFSVLGRTYLQSRLTYGDMVAFKNAKTKEILGTEGKDIENGFIKRIVAMAGDTVELRDGYVYRNGELLSEPYITSPRSTYGGAFLKDCEIRQVPEGQLFVLGDNRKVSSDSRFELGFVTEEDIEYFLPLSSQAIYKSLWRDTTKDKELMGMSTLSDNEFVTLVNETRRSQGLKNLKIVDSLSRSATSRGSKLIKDQNTTYTLKQAVAGSGYSNIVLGEFISQGHYSASELYKSMVAQPSMKGQVFSPDFTDIGISAVNGDIAGCPTQFIVGHLGGYVPAEYDESLVSSWRALSLNLRGVIPSWEKALSYEGIDKSKVKSLIDLLNKRLRLADEIVRSMERKEWLTSDQEARIKSDENDSNQAEVWANELNK
jgi:signal peptidase I